jgi:hypothetical protein
MNMMDIIDEWEDESGLFFNDAYHNRNNRHALARCMHEIYGIFAFDGHVTRSLYTVAGTRYDFVVSRYGVKTHFCSLIFFHQSYRKSYQHILNRVWNINKVSCVWSLLINLNKYILPVQNWIGLADQKCETSPHTCVRDWPRKNAHFCHLVA